MHFFPLLPSTRKVLIAPDGNESAPFYSSPPFGLLGFALGLRCVAAWSKTERRRGGGGAKPSKTKRIEAPGNCSVFGKSRQKLLHSPFPRPDSLGLFSRYS